jgi:hypothetical protein
MERVTQLVAKHNELDLIAQSSEPVFGTSGNGVEREWGFEREEG